MSRYLVRCLQALITGILLLLLAACGGSSSGSGSGSNTPPPPTVTITISPTSATVLSGGTQQFQANVTGSSNTTVQWEVNNIVGGNAQVGTISTTGLYTAPTTNVSIQVTVTAIANADTSKTANAMVTVNPPPPPPPPTIKVTISPMSALLAVTTTQQFTAAVTGTTNTAVTWSVDGVTGGNSTVGTISTGGLYTAPSTAGTHTVTATSVADSTANASATASVISLTVSPKTAKVAPLGTKQFTATVAGTSNNGVTWSVDGVVGGNKSVGTISTSGLYTAPASPGSHTITATSVALTTLSASAAITVMTVSGAVSMTTYHNDDVRDGANTNETALNTSNVNSQQFGKLAALQVDGQIYAQPLYVPNLAISGIQHNVVFVATENDTVYAFDGDGLSDSPLWSQHLATPVPVNDQEGIKPLLGITSTPVIDTDTGTMYVLTDGLKNGKKVYRLHALDIISGNEKFGGPVVVTGTVPGTGWDSHNGQITLEDNCYQRSGLALDTASNAIYISFGHCSHGWVLAYDKASLQQTAILNTTPDGAGGTVWGGTPAIDDSTGDLYLITGVDLGDPAPDYNDSAIRLRASDLSLLDYFKPSNEAFLRQNDADFGSGAAIIMPDNPSQYPHELIGGGKDGRIFVINRDNMGQFQTTDHVIQEVQTGTQEFDNIFATPTYWKGTIYYHCENDVVKAYNWDSNTGLISTSPISQGNVTYGVHGATSSLSANGSADGILWEIESSNVYQGGPAILHAYDAKDLGDELYNSQQANGRDTAGPAVKFTVPTVADGHVFVGTASELDIYGLLSY